MSIQLDFETFHGDNPQVLRELERLAGQWFAAGHHTCAIGMLWEVLRWETGIRTNTDDEFRLNNNYRSRYVRLLIRRNPSWAGRFNVRELRAA